MELKIIEYPDKKLKEKSLAVEHFDENLHQLLDAMYPLMIGTNGIGLAAIQVAHAKRVLLLSIPNEEGEQPKESLIEMINPVITKRRHHCLSRRLPECCWIL